MGFTPELLGVSGLCVPGAPRTSLGLQIPVPSWRSFYFQGIAPESAKASGVTGGRHSLQLGIQRSWKLEGL